MISPSDVLFKTDIALTCSISTRGCATAKLFSFERIFVLCGFRKSLSYTAPLCKKTWNDARGPLTRPRNSAIFHA